MIYKLTPEELAEIDAQVRADIENEINKAKAKAAAIANKGKNKPGREVELTAEQVNTFNALVAGKNIRKSCRGSIDTVTITIKETILTMVKTEKIKDTDPIQYLVQGGIGKDFIATKDDAITDLSERAVLASRED